MINKEWRNGNASATAIGDWDALELTYKDRYLGEISHTFYGAYGKYDMLYKTNHFNDEDVIKYIKEQILFAKGE